VRLAENQANDLPRESNRLETIEVHQNNCLKLAINPFHLSWG
jgi:hypothetical protein